MTNSLIPNYPPPPAAYLNLFGSRKDVISFCELLRSHGITVVGEEQPGADAGEQNYQLKAIPKDGIGSEINLYVTTRDAR